MRRFLVVELALVAALSLAAAQGFHRVFVGTGFLGLIAGAALLPVVVTVLCGARRMSLSGAILASAVVFVLFALFVPLAGLTSNPMPTLVTMQELGKGLVSGWAELRTVSLPTEADPRLLVTAAAVVWLGATLGAEMAARSRTPVAPVIGPLAAYAASLLFAAGQPRSPVLLPLVITAGCLLVILLHANRWATLEPGGRRLSAPPAADGRPQAATAVNPVRRVVTGVPVIGVALLVAALVGSLVNSQPERAAFEPRPLRSANVDSRSLLNPLAGLRQELEDPPVVVFKVETDRLSDALSVPRARLATFDVFDGTTWSSNGEFAKSGTVLAEVPEGSTVTRRQVTQRYTLGALMGPWLPVTAFPVGIELQNRPVDLEFDPSSGTLITDDVALDGLRYQLQSSIPEYTEQELTGADLATGDEARSDEELPGVVPEAITSLATELTSSAITPYQKLKALEEGLSSGFGYSQEVAPGHSYGHIVNFLTEARVGYAEQFAGSFAVMARSLGFPTRLAVGYLTVEPNDTDGQLEALQEVTTHQAHVWPEVYFDKLGWVPFEPTPADRTSSPAPPPRAEQPAVSEGGLVEEQSPPAGSSDEVSPESLDTPDALDSGVIILLGLLALAAGAVTGLLAAKALVRGRRRRRAHTPSQQVLGAWAEVIDRLLEVGVDVDRSMTARQVVELSNGQISDRAQESLEAMVPIVSYAVYAPIEPSDEWVSQMRVLADDFNHAVVAGRPLPQRAMAALSPRPLLYSARR